MAYSPGIDSLRWKMHCILFLTRNPLFKLNARKKNLVHHCAFQFLLCVSDKCAANNET